MLLTRKKPINFSKDEVEKIDKVVAHRNTKKTKEEKKETFSSVSRETIMLSIEKELKQIEKGQ